MFCILIRIGLLFGILISIRPASAENANREALCEVGLTGGDAFTPAEMAIVRRAAGDLRPHLAEWSRARLKLNSKSVDRTLSKLRSTLDVDAEPLRLLYLAVGRFLLAAKGIEGRLRPLAEALGVGEAEVDALVNFFAQLDVFAEYNRTTANFPFFLRATGPELLERDLHAAPLTEASRQTLGGLVKVLGRRARYARLSADPTGRRLVLRSAVGTYLIDVREEPIKREALASVDVQPSTQWGRQNDLNLTSAISVGRDDGDLVSYLRTMIRGDAFFHPHLFPPFLELFSLPARLSPVQRQVLKDLLLLDVEAEARQVEGPVTLGHTEPTGEGKTVVNAGYVKEMIKHRWSGRRPKIILSVENVNILRQTVESFVRDLGIDPSKIAMMFGELMDHEFGVGPKAFTVAGGAGRSPPADFDLLVVSRSSLSDRKSSLDCWIDQENAKPPGERRPFLFIGDEGHHFGAEDGQYQKILRWLRAKLTIEDRILIVSATFAHPKRNIVVDDLDGNIVASHLGPAELAQLRRGENLDYLSLVQFLRATIEGYVNPIDDQSFTLAASLAAAETLRQRLGRKEVADAEIYESLAKMIKDLRRPGIMDRWIFFEVRQDRAKDGADHLRRAFGRNAVEFVHSGLSAVDQKFAVDWFMDRGAHRGTRYQHKIIETVSQMIEGTDVPGANGIAVLRNLTSDRVAQQILGRAARLRAFKVSFRLADVTGRILEYLQRADDLWRRAHLGFAETERTEDEPKILPVEKEDDPVGPVNIQPNQISIEDSIERERINLVAMKTVDPTARITGGWSSLVYQPGGEATGTTIDVAERMTEWFKLFPAPVRARARALFALTEWPKAPVDLTAPGVRDAQKIRAALETFVRVFNSIPEGERFGLPPLSSVDVTLPNGLARLFAFLDPAFPCGLAEDFAATPFGTKDGLRLYTAIREGRMFSPTISKQFVGRVVRANARESLKMIRAMSDDRVFLQTPAALTVLAAAEQVSSEARATYLLGRLLDAVLTPPGLARVGGWDVNLAFDLPPHPNLGAPSLPRFWLEIGRLDAEENAHD